MHAPVAKLLRVAFWAVAAPPLAALAQTLTIDNDIQTHATLNNTTVTLTGRSELRITGTSDPISGSTIHLNSPDAWLLFTGIKPSVVNSTYLAQVRVNGSVAVNGTNVRVVQYALGAVVIPHVPSIQPFQAFTGPHFTGTAQSFGLYTYYNSSSSLGVMFRNIRSFKLKRGYMATIATQANGTGISRNYVAQDGDLDVPLLPTGLDGAIRFVRVFPWRWVSKKGASDLSPATLGAAWFYNWNNNTNSTSDYEYVPIRQQRYWPDLPTNKPDSTHLLGYNEPDNPVEDAYTTLGNGSVDTAVSVWPELQGSGLRLGSPAVTDGGKAWLYEFMDKAIAQGRRVDYIAIHNYQCGNSATTLYNWLKDVWDRYHLPIWVTEFNNGANWTSCADPTLEQNATAIGSFIDMMDNAPFIERYAVYSAVESVRQMTDSNGALTPAGTVYKNNASPLSYTQELPEAATSAAAFFPFDGSALDRSGNGQPAMTVGSPAFPAGRIGQAIALDGADDYVQVSPRLGDSTDFSFAGWIKWSGGANWQRIFDLGAFTFRYMFLSPSAGNGKLRFAINTGGGEQTLDAPSALATGVWTHVAVTIKGDTGKLFVNGALVATNAAMTANPASIGTQYNYLGKSQFPADPRFNGQLDDIQFLPYALTDAQVAAMPANTAPQFSSATLTLDGATAGEPYSATLADSVSDAQGDAITFSKVSGPAWLSVAADGRLLGIPAVSDAGSNTLLVRAEDPFGGIALAAVVVPVTAPPAMQVRYAFDGDVRASVGSADGTAVGSPAFTAGKYGQALVFDGVDDVVTLPAGVADVTDLTIATWVYWNGTGNWQRIFDFGTGTEQYMFLTPRHTDTGVMRFAIRNGGAEQVVSAPSALPANQWVHVAVTLSGDAARLYLNGSQVATGAVTINPIDFRPTINYLGDSQFAADPFFAGRLDEFLIYNYALPSSAIAALYAGRAPSFTTKPFAAAAATPGLLYRESIATAATDPEGGTLHYAKTAGPAWLHIAQNGRLYGRPEAGDAGRNHFRVRVTDPQGLSDEATLAISVTGASGLVAQYLFDGNANDSAGSNHGTALGSPGYVPSPFQSAIRLDGTSSRHVALPAGVGSSAAITLTARVRWQGGANWQRILDFGSGTSQYFYLTPKNGETGTVRFGIRNAGEQTLDAPTALPVGEWAHVAVTLGSGTGKIYVNGAKVGTSAITHTPSAFNPTLNYVGKSQWASDPFLNADVDEVRIYNRALGEAEVLGIAAAPLTTNPTARLAFDAWAADRAFAAGEDNPQSDPDRDGLPNILEFLFGTDPLVAGPPPLSQGGVATAAQLGLGDTGKTYQTLTVRLRKDRAGVLVVPRAAATLDALADPASAANAALAGTVDDGGFELVTYYYTTPIEDSPAGFMSLGAALE
jgi:hypothetical protein